MQTNKKLSFKNLIFGILFIILALYSLFLIVLLLWGLLTSFKSELDFTYMHNYLGFPDLNKENFTNSRDALLHFSNYKEVFNNFSFTLKNSYWRGSELVSRQTIMYFGRFFAKTNEQYYSNSFIDMTINTILYSGIGALIVSFMPALTAYLCAKYDFKFSKIVFAVYTFLMCLPIVGNFPSEINFLRSTGLYDTFYGNFIQKMSGGGMYFFVFYAYFKGLSNTYREAAEIDGASELQIMVRVYLPLAIKLIFTVYLIQFVHLWNDYQTPLLYLPTHPTLAYGIYYNVIVSNVATLNSEPIRISACMVLAVPIVLLFVIFKEKLMGNITLGGIKE